MELSITIAKVQHATRCINPVYVGRPMPLWKPSKREAALWGMVEPVRRGSPLGNPFRPPYAIDQYARWLQLQSTRSTPAMVELARLIGLLNEKKHISLVCWCADRPRTVYTSFAGRPDACHADVIGLALLLVFDQQPPAEYLQTTLFDGAEL